MDGRAGLLRQLAQEASTCRRCWLNGHRTRVVFHDGRVSPVMVVGEAPGAEEDAEGRPFVGKAGRLLRQVLHAVGVNPERLYVSNVLKCRPPDNKFPEDPEPVENCLPWLMRQIDVLQPRCLLAVGRVAMRTLAPASLEGRGIGGASGRVWPVDIGPSWPVPEGIDVFAVVHPSYVLRCRSEAARTGGDPKEPLVDFVEHLVLFREHLKATGIYEEVKL